MLAMGAFVATLVLLGILDGIWLFSTRRFYRQQLAELMAARPNWPVAGLFYLLYAAGVTYFVTNPAIAEDRPVTGLWRGALLGLLAYGTYDLTNQATLKKWPSTLTVVDLIWGTVVTALVGFGATYLMTRVFR
jgi:uncharacterized membrane protein